MACCNNGLIEENVNLDEKLDLEEDLYIWLERQMLPYVRSRDSDGSRDSSPMGPIRRGGFASRGGRTKDRLLSKLSNT